jgi:hypothetical protein
MIAWLWSKLVGQFCWHHWVILDRCDFVGIDGKKIGIVVHLQCDKCGDVMRRTL